MLGVTGGYCGNYLSESVKSTVAGLPPSTVTSFFSSLGSEKFTAVGVCVVFQPSCHITIWYLPGGTFLISYLPSSPVSAKYGCGVTCTTAFIQMWPASHFAVTVPGLVTFCSLFWPWMGWAKLKTVEVPR